MGDSGEVIIAINHSFQEENCGEITIPLNEQKVDSVDYAEQTISHDKEQNIFVNELRNLKRKPVEVGDRDRSQAKSEWPKLIKINESLANNEGIFVRAKINDKYLAFLVDTGANVTILIEYTINTGNHPPVRQRPRRIPLARMKDDEAEIQKMVKQDIIEPSTSPWNSNIVVVKKSDDSWVFCIDFRSTEVKFLGHIVSESGVATDPNKIQSVKDWPVPKSIKDVLASYDFKIEHGAGRSHNNADALSRRTCYNKECPHCARAEINYELVPTHKDSFTVENCNDSVTVSESCRNVQDVSAELSVTKPSISCINEDMRPNLTSDETCHKVKSHVIHNKFKSKCPERNPYVLPVRSKIVRVCTRSKDYGCSQNEKDNPVTEINFENVSESQLSDDVISIIIYSVENR
ncbi:unnamed protein product [Mytilus coruscus]|uniref:Peptidase A2 domain-containing protein n=1 Tax=Mytilus coruscus TaxID=42192 RepID=A0A6J8EI59_MYTCO|nr:unnamed protein product [Mytilus coruscus]